MRMTGTWPAALVIPVGMVAAWQVQVTPPTVAIDRVEASSMAARSGQSFSAAKEKDLLPVTGLDVAEFAKLSGAVGQHRQRLDDVQSSRDRHVRLVSKGNRHNSVELNALRMEPAKAVAAAMAEMRATGPTASRNVIERFLPAPHLGRVP